MVSEAEAKAPQQGTSLAVIEVQLSIESSGARYATTTQLRQSSSRIAREAAQVIAALLFAQRQMRAINDPARLTAVEAITRTCQAARNGSLQRPTIAASSRVAGTYVITLLAGQSFKIDIDAKIDGLVLDAAGGLTTDALAAELLTTLAEPYRTFYREMLDTAVGYWRQRRPSVIESTWAWPVALRRLDQLTRGGAAIAGEPQACESCGLDRPSGTACLHCGAMPGLTAVPLAAPAAVLSPTPAASLPLAATAPEAIAAPAPTGIIDRPVSRPVAPSAPAPRPAEEPAHAIAPAQELAAVAVEGSEPEEPPLPLAGFGRRLGATLLDLLSGAALSVIGAFGLTAILLRAQAFGPEDSPRSFLALAVFGIFALYFVLGWAKSETLGSFLFRLRILQAGSRRPAGLLRSAARGIGYIGLFAVALVVFLVLNLIDQQLVFIQGTADLIVRIITGVIALYILWVGWGQAIISGRGRQTWGDRLAGTLVTLRKS